MLNSMDIYQFNDEGRKISLVSDLTISHSVLRIFFSGFSQDGALLSELIKAHQGDKPVLCTKKAYGLVAKQRIGVALDHDCLIVSNYQVSLDESNKGSEFAISLLDSSLLESIVHCYERIEIVAWSFGVRVARALAQALPELKSKISYAVALCGTVPSVDLNYGIDPKAYDGTLERFTSVMHKQFIKNMCAYAQVQEIGVESVPLASDSELIVCSSEDRSLVDKVRALPHDFKSELQFMPYVALDSCQDTNVTYEPITELEEPAFYFNEAYVALGDKIMPPSAQYHYWSAYGLMRLECGNAPGFCLNTFYGPHLCPSLIKDVMLDPVHTSIQSN